MLEGLQAEINAHAEFTGASNRIIMQVLNTDGTAQTESWAVNDTEIKIPKGDIMAMLSLESLGAVLTWMRAENDVTALVFHEFYLAHERFKVTDQMFRTLISGLETGGLITTTEKDAVLRLGERKISRAEELFERKLELTDFE